MPLTPCRECGRQISTQSRFCPGCGAPYPSRPVWTGSGRDWKSRTRVFGIPLVHVAYGRDNQGGLRVAKGIIAVGQFGVGLITIAQFGVGILFGVGQFIFGLTALAQFAGALLVGVGQLATGVLAVGQVVAGIFGLAQDGVAKYMWSPSRVDMEAVAMFSTIALKLQQLIGL